MPDGAPADLAVDVAAAVLDVADDVDGVDVAEVVVPVGAGAGVVAAGVVVAVAAGVGVVARMPPLNVTVLKWQVLQAALVTGWLGVLPTATLPLWQAAHGPSAWTWSMKR